MKQTEKLEKLIDEHEIIFLSTDTRESRWLPTLIATSKHKIIVNVAMGFDSFLVQRFGIRLRNDDEIDQQSKFYPLFQEQQKQFQQYFPDPKQSSIYLGSELGCYFCNDIVAPTNVIKPV